MYMIVLIRYLRPQGLRMMIRFKRTVDVGKRTSGVESAGPRPVEWPLLVGKGVDTAPLPTRTRYLVVLYYVHRYLSLRENVWVD